MIKKQTIYVAGPMRGYEDFNYPAFHEAERILESIGWDVVNPAKMDAEELDKKEGVDPLTFDPHKSAEDQETLRHLLSRDLEAVAKKCTAIYMLDGWEESRGALAEWQLARALGIKIYYEPRYPHV
tara:strand:+ start:638 stop:1015 length:378 start_codon:yes stop_codon:yes gene_type:complete